jgi:microcystin-dependent protein
VVAVNTTKNRLDLLVLDNGGSLAIRKGTEAVSPVTPTPTSGDTVLVSVYNIPGETSIKDRTAALAGYITEWYDLAVYGSIIPAGIVSPYAGSSAPTGWLLCDGSAVSRSTYSALFSVTSTTYGVGDGSTTFNLPDLRSRIPVGAGTGTKVATFASRSGNVITVTGLTNAANNEFQTGQAIVYNTSGTVITGLTNATTYYVIRVTNTSFSLATSLANANAGTAIALSSDGTGTQTFTKTFTARTRGDTGGEENHLLNTTELASHRHQETVTDYTGSNPGIPAYTGANMGSGPGIGAGTNSGQGGALNTVASGGDTPHSIMQPFVVLNYIIKV